MNDQQVHIAISIFFSNQQALTSVRIYTCDQGILPNNEKIELETPVVILRLQMSSIKSLTNAGTRCRHHHTLFLLFFFKFICIRIYNVYIYIYINI